MEGVNFKVILKFDFGIVYQSMIVYTFIIKED